MEVARLVTQPFCEQSAFSLSFLKYHISFQRCRLSIFIVKRVMTGDIRDTAVGIDESRVDGVRRTWPSRVPFKINCSAIFAVTRRCRGSRCVKGKKERNQRLLCKT
jgi:hypothetical protein